MAYLPSDDFIEPRRLAALHAYRIMDTADDPALDRVVRLARRLFDCDIALVSLVEAARCRHVAVTGWSVHEVDRADAFCNVAIQQSETLVVPDASLDARFANNPFVVDEPRIRFYASAPIITTQGSRIGTLAVLDRSPRPGLTGDEHATLTDLAGIVLTHLESVRQIRLSELDAEQARATRYFDRIATARSSDEAMQAVLTDGIAQFGAQSGRLWKVSHHAAVQELVCCVSLGAEVVRGPIEPVQSPESVATRATLDDGPLQFRADAVTGTNDPLAAIMQAEGTACAIVLPTIIGSSRFVLIMTFMADCKNLGSIAAQVTNLLDILAPVVRFTEAGLPALPPMGRAGAPITPQNHTERSTQERRSAERSTQERDASFRLMFEDNPLPLVVYDALTLAIIEVNEAATLSYGYSHQDFVRLNVLELVPEEDRADARAFVAQLDDQPANSSWTHVRASGERIRVQVITHPLPFAGRRARIAVFWDVTEVEYARDALRQSNQELLVLAGQLQARTADLTEVNRRARLGIWLMPTDGGPAEWSDEIFDIFGRPAERPGPDFNTLLSWIAPSDRTRVREIVTRATAQRTAHSFEFRAVQPGGGIRHCLGDLRPDFDFVNRLTSLKGFCQDITERKETELALLRSEKLKTIGQFTGGVAHDFNNLLTVMMLNVEEAIDTLPSNHPLQPLLGPVLHAAMRGSELTSQLLSYARRSPLEPMHVSLQNLFDGLNPLLDRILGDRFTLEVRHGEGVVQPFVDAAKLENAVLNLVINARDAMATGGTIVISTAVATLGPRDAGGWSEFVPGDYALISVTDSGCGIAPDVFPRVFEPFFTTKAVGKGSGLGLSMVYGFAKQSGGHVAITSEINVGTTATLYLPLHGGSDTATSKGPKAASQAVAPRMTALLVEDQPEVLETVKRQLIALGFKVIVAADAARAMDHITSSSMLDLLFSDVAIPGPIDGTQLAAIARQRHPDIRILLTSGYMDHTGATTTDLAYGTEFLQKPYSRADLAERLAAMFPAVALDDVATR